MANSTPGGKPNEGKTDMNRGSVDAFSFSKEQRDTGKVGGAGSKQNSNKVDDNKVTSGDKRTS